MHHRNIYIYIYQQLISALQDTAHGSSHHCSAPCCSSILTMAAPMLSCVMVNLAGEMLAAFKLECGHPWKSELLQAQGNMLRGPVRVLMGHEQVYPGCGLVPDYMNDDAVVAYNLLHAEQPLPG